MTPPPKMRPRTVPDARPPVRNDRNAVRWVGSENCQNPLDSPALLTYHPRTKRVPAALKCLGAQIAQLVEQRIENPRVGGSIPSLGTT